MCTTANTSRRSTATGACLLRMEAIALHLHIHHVDCVVAGDDLLGELTAAGLQHVDDARQRDPDGTGLVLDQLFEIAELAVELLTRLVHRCLAEPPGDIVLRVLWSDGG